MRETEDARCWVAVTRTTCAVCLDRGSNGQCHVPSRGHDCPLRTFFPAVIDVVRRTRSDTMDAYVDAIEADVCATCRESGDDGCPRRERGECALYMYLPLTVEAVETALAARA